MYIVADVPMYMHMYFGLLGILCVRTSICNQCNRMCN